MFEATFESLREFECPEWFRGVCQVFCVSFLEKILWGGEPPRL